MPFPRRDFLRRGVALATACSVIQDALWAQTSPGLRGCPIAVFSKVYQELSLNYRQTAEITAQAGLDGIDCPVRAGGQILPERAAEELPRLAEVLKEHRLKIHLLTTGIQSPATPHAETVLRIAKQLGVKYYRLAYWNYQNGVPPENRLNEIKSQLKDLAALNRDIGVCSILQNHSGTNIVGANVRDNYELARGFDPEHIALAFDLGHAINQLKDQWHEEFLKLRSHFRVAYVKDFKRGGGFVALGQGDIARTNYFQLLKDLKYSAPISLHVEYDWNAGREKTTEGLLKAIRNDLRILKQWLQV